MSSAHIKQNSFGEFQAPDYKSYIKQLDYDFGDDEFFETDLSGPFANSSALLNQIPMNGNDLNSPSAARIGGGNYYENTAFNLSEKRMKECQQFVKNSIKKPSIMGIKTPDESVVEKEGYTSKEGKFFSKSWKKRWLILSAESLSYYMNNQCKGVVFLEGCVCHFCKTRADAQNCIEVVVKPLKGQDNKPADFQLQTAQNLVNGKTFYFKFDTLQEAKNWLIAINQSISKILYKKRIFNQHMGLDDRVLDYLRNSEQECLDLSDHGNFFAEACAEQNLYVDAAKQFFAHQQNGSMEKDITETPTINAANPTLTDDGNNKSVSEYQDTNTNTNTNSEVGDTDNDEKTEKDDKITASDSAMSPKNMTPNSSKQRQGRANKSLIRIFINSALSSLENTLKCSEYLKELILRNCDLGDEGLKTLASILRDNNTIHTLDLSENLLLDNSMSQFLISAGLKNNGTLKFLDLSKNLLGDESMTIFTHILSSKRLPLKHLILSKNNITDTGAKKLFEGLKKNATVEVLELEYNQLSGDCFSSNVLSTPEKAPLATSLNPISEVLRSKTCCIQQLLLGHNLLSNVGAKALSEAIVQNQSMKVLGVEYNNISFEGISQICGLLEKNTFLQELRIGGNSLTEKSLSVLMEVKNGFCVSEIEIKSCKA